MRVAIVHYWFVGMRGGEKVVEALIRLYPQADLFTHVIDPTAVSQTILAPAEDELHPVASPRGEILPAISSAHAARLRAARSARL